MKGLLGKKVGMAQIFDESGAVTPVTIIEAGPCYVTQVKTEKTDGYTAVQIGFSEISEKRLTKGQQGHLGLLKKGRGSKKVQYQLFGTCVSFAPKMYLSIPWARH